MLEIQGLNAWWGQAQALFDLSLNVASGELVVLQGLNGAGKSTLLQAIIGIGPSVQGKVCYPINSDTTTPAQDISHWPAHRRAQAGLAYVAEDRRLFHGLSVRDNLLIAARAGAVAAETGRSAQQGAGKEKHIVAERLDSVLALFPALATMLAREVSHMSGGEQQMLAIARSLMTGPRLLLLDEPCEGIAPLVVESIVQALLALRRDGMTMLVAEQNQVLAAQADRSLSLIAGHWA